MAIEEIEATVFYLKRKIDQLADTLETIKKTIEKMKGGGKRKGGESPLPWQLKRSNIYTVVEFDLSIEREEVEVANIYNIFGHTPGNSLTILSVPSPFKYAINSPKFGMMDANVGDKIEHEDIYRIIVTNSSGTGIAKIRVTGWVERKVGY